MNTIELIKNLKKLSSDKNFNVYRQSTVEKILEVATINSNIRELVDQNYEFSNYFENQTSLFKELIYQDVCGLGPISLFLGLDEWLMITLDGTEKLCIDFQATSPIELPIGLIQNRPSSGVYHLVAGLGKRLDEQFPIFSSLVENFHFQISHPPASSNIWIRVIQMKEFKKDWPDYNP